MAKLLSKERKRELSLKYLPRIFYFLIKLLIFTCKIEHHFPKQKPKMPLLVSFWHEYLLLGSFIFREFLKDEKVSVIASEHFDGKVIAKTISYYDIGYIQGSSTRGGIKALKISFQLLDAKECVAITPDGPRGPRREVADGLVAISQKKDVDIVAFSYSASSFWRLKSWDKFIIPKPFSTIKLYASEPFSLKGLDKDEAKELVKEKLSHVV